MKYHYGKCVLLTGGSSGIGLATAELLAQSGYTVYAASRKPALDIRDFPGGGEIRPVAIDVCDKQSVDLAVNTILSKADIGIIIHCAGIGIACAAEDFHSEAVEGLIDTNFSGILRLNSHILPHMRQRGGGLCVLIGSMAGIFPIPFQSHYSAMKSALDTYSSALRMELLGYGVKVSLVMPGDMNTGFTGSRKYAIDPSSPYYSACIKAVGKMEKDEISGRPPASAAHIIRKLISRRNPPIRKIIGFEYKLLALLRRFLPLKIVEFILRKMYS